MTRHEITSTLPPSVCPKPGEVGALKIELIKPVKWVDRHYVIARAICLAFWFGGPAISYLAGGPIKLLGYLVTLGLYCLARDAWHILRGEM